jgi:hypothetical protein
VLKLTQVFDLAELLGRRPVGNVRKLNSGGFRLRYREPDGEMCASPVIYATRAAAGQALWRLAAEDQVHIEHDRRFRALVLLATFASLRWGEVTALRRSDIDLMTRTVRVREQLVELDGGDMVLSPPKSRAGKRVVGIPAAIIAALREHLDAFVEDRPDAFVFLGAGGGFLRGGNFRREASWAQALADMGLSGLHLLSRPGARFRCCHRPVSPDRSPNPPYRSLGNGLSTVSAGQAGLGVGHGVGILLPR